MIKEFFKLMYVFATCIITGVIMMAAIWEIGRNNLIIGAGFILFALVLFSLAFAYSVAGKGFWK